MRCQMAGKNGGSVPPDRSKLSALHIFSVPLGHRKEFTMNAFISTDRDTILERLQGEKLLNIVPDELGNVLLVFESAYPDASDLLAVKPGGKLIATLACDSDDDAKPVEDCPLDATPCTGNCPDTTYPRHL